VDLVGEGADVGLIEEGLGDVGVRVRVRRGGGEPEEGAVSGLAPVGLVDAAAGRLGAHLDAASVDGDGGDLGRVEDGVVDLPGPVVLVDPSVAQGLEFGSDADGELPDVGFREVQVGEVGEVLGGLLEGGLVAAGADDLLEERGAIVLGPQVEVQVPGGKRLCGTAGSGRAGRAAESCPRAS
jgi:hypothetical protein